MNANVSHDLQLDKIIRRNMNSTPPEACNGHNPITADLPDIAPVFMPSCSSVSGSLPDFVAESADMKRVMTIQFEQSSVSVMVHRIGNTLFLDGEMPQHGLDADKETSLSRGCRQHASHAVETALDTSLGTRAIRSAHADAHRGRSLAGREGPEAGYISFDRCALMQY